MQAWWAAAAAAAEPIGLGVPNCGAQHVEPAADPVSTDPCVGPVSGAESTDASGDSAAPAGSATSRVSAV